MSNCEDEYFSGGHQGHNHDDHDHGHGHNHDHGAAPIPTNESQSLNSKILTTSVSALNMENPSSELPGLFKDRAHKYSLQPCFKSDADNQIILKVPFEGSVKLYSVILRTSSQTDHCPKVIKFYNTSQDLDFDSVGSAEVTYQVEHPEVGVDDSGSVASELVDDSSFVEHYLPRSHFSGVSTLTMFFENNWSDDEDEQLHIYSVEFRGEFQYLRKNPVVTIYESAANPADHAKVKGSHFNLQNVD